MKRVILVLIIIFCKRASTARQDLLENIRVSKANEPELNDFLRSVLRHKEDFRWIRNSVDRIRLQQLTRNLYATSAPDEVDEEFNPAYVRSFISLIFNPNLIFVFRKVVMTKKIYFLIPKRNAEVAYHTNIQSIDVQ